MERHQAELAALAGEPDLPALELDLPPLQPCDLAQPQSGEREQEEDDLFPLATDPRVELGQLLVAVGRGVVLGQPRQPHISGRIPRHQLMPPRVAVGGTHVGEMPPHRRDRLPLEHLVEVLLTPQQRELARCHVLLVEPTLRLLQRMPDRFDRQRRRTTARERPADTVQPTARTDPRAHPQRRARAAPG